MSECHRSHEPNEETKDVLRQAARGENLCGPISLEEFLGWCDRPTPRWKFAWWWLLGLPSRTKWFFLHRFHPGHRYNVVKTGLRPGYYDFDVRMEASIVRLFLDYVEEETRFGWPHETHGDGFSDKTMDYFEKIKALHEYFRAYDRGRSLYKVELPDWKNFESVDDWSAACDECKAREAILKTEFDEKLLEVVRLRDYYWT